MAKLKELFEMLSTTVVRLDLILEMGLFVTILEASQDRLLVVQVPDCPEAGLVVAQESMLLQEGYSDKVVTLISNLDEEFIMAVVYDYLYSRTMAFLQQKDQVGESWLIEIKIMVAAASHYRYWDVVDKVFMDFNPK